MRRFAPSPGLLVVALIALAAALSGAGAAASAAGEGTRADELYLLAQGGSVLSRLSLDDLPDVTQARRLFRDRPLAGAVLVALAFVVGVLVASLLPVLFATRDLDLRRSYLLAGLVFVSWVALSALVVLLDYVWEKIQWSPWTGVSNAAATVVAAVTGIAVALVAFRLRIAVSWQQTLIVTAIWLLFVAGCGLVVWIFLLPVLPF